MRWAILGLVAWAVAACDPGQQALVDALRPPAIAAQPIPAFTAGGTPPTLSATITPAGGAIEIVRVELRVNRDRDPARFDPASAPAFEVTPVPQGGAVSVTLPQTFELQPAQLLTAQWAVDYKLREGTEIASAVSTVISGRANCTLAEVATFLLQLQAAATNPAFVPQTLSGPAEVALLGGLGYVPSHGFLSFNGMGTAFAHGSALSPQALIDTAASLGLPQFNAFRPHLLLYAPSPAAAAAAVNEPLVPDFPYTLIGIAFAAPYNPDGPPVFGCMPREAWFVHNAGWHLANGLFVSQAVPGEAALGDDNPQLPTPLVVGPNDPRFGAVWHSRLWDVHLWFRSPALPILSACNTVPPTARPPDFFATSSVATCGPGVARTPVFGAAFPPTGFFARTLPR